MKVVKIAMLLLIVGLMSSCGHDDKDNIDDNLDYLIFGRYIGLCVGEQCVEFYKLKGDKLYEDVNDYYSEKPQFEFVELDNDKYEQVKDLLGFIPPGIYSEKEKKYGCPNCVDQGALYIEVRKNGQVKSLELDQVKDQVPAYLHEFMDKINEKINLLDSL